MTVYNVGEVQDLLGVGRSTAYMVMQKYGFRIGYGKTSALRITEEGVKKWIREKERENENESV